MNKKYRKTIIAGNWKMNQTASGIKPFMEELKNHLPQPKPWRSCSALRLSWFQP